MAQVTADVFRSLNAGQQREYTDLIMDAAAQENVKGGDVYTIYFWADKLLGADLEQTIRNYVDEWIEVIGFGQRFADTGDLGPFISTDDPEATSRLFDSQNEAQPPIGTVEWAMTVEMRNATIAPGSFMGLTLASRILPWLRSLAALGISYAVAAFATKNDITQVGDVVEQATSSGGAAISKAIKSTVWPLLLILGILLAYAYSKSR